MYIDDLSKDCRDAAKSSNSRTKYFGHEVETITSLVEEALCKGNNFSNISGLSRKSISAPGNSNSSVDTLFKKGIELFTFLIQFHEPWQDLTSSLRSITSTNLLISMEKAMFQLADVDIKSDVSNKTRLNNNYDWSFFPFEKFLVKVESWERGVATDHPYQFPSETEDSFIKLPEKWTHAVENADKHVKIAAMSIHANYVSYIMPGQYGTDDGGTEKLMNGRLISLSLKTQSEAINDLEENPACVKGTRENMSSIWFQDRGVLITFEHDKEAWGDKKHTLYRKLHEGEQPTAVLESAECVFWDNIDK